MCITNNANTTKSVDGLIVHTELLPQSIVSDKFKQNFGKTFSHLGQIGKEVTDNDLRSLFFGDYINPADVNKLYDEITDFDALKDVRTKS